MIALVHVDMERRLDAIADVLPLGVADLHLHIAHHRVRNPGDHTLQHVLVIELARRLVLAHRGEADDAQRPTRAHEFPIRHGRIRIGHRRLDEAMRGDPHHELPHFGLIVLSLRLALRIQGPGIIAVDQCRRALLARDRKAGATAARRIVALHAYHLFLDRLVAVVDGLRPVLQVDARPIVRGGEILAEIADPSSPGVLDGIDFARADGVISRLQQGSCILGGYRSDRRPQHESRYYNQRHEYVSHIAPPEIQDSPRYASDLDRPCRKIANLRLGYHKSPPTLHAQLGLTDKSSQRRAPAGRCETPRVYWQRPGPVIH